MRTSSVSVYEVEAQETMEPMEPDDVAIDTPFGMHVKGTMRARAIWLVAKLMKWFDLRVWRKTITYTHHQIDLTGLDGIHRQVTMIEERGHKPKYVVVGREDWSKLMVECRDRLGPDTLTTIRHPYTQAIFGVPVVLVPWLSGTFVMPEPED